MSPDLDLLQPVEQYYSAKLRAFGATSRGVDWNTPESQSTRFEQLLKVCDPGGGFSINDYGCGYGALVDYLASKQWRFAYRGFDISADMVLTARAKHAPDCVFVSSQELLSPADYTVASGIFNVKLEASTSEWEAYVLATLHKLTSLSTKGFAFNALTSYSDPHRMRDDLYYADPCFLFDYCKRNFSRNVSLLHDYGLYEFTILVRI